MEAGIDAGDDRAQAYTDEDFLATVVAGYAAAGLARRDGVVLIATPSHTKSFLERLAAARVDVHAALGRRQLLVLDVAAALGRVMVAGAPAREPLRSMIADALAHVRAAGHGRVRIYGEMVDLASAPDLDAALSLEALWSEILEDRRLSLLCAYRLGASDDRVRDLLGQIARRHTELGVPEGHAGRAAAPVFALRHVEPRRVSARRSASRTRRSR